MHARVTEAFYHCRYPSLLTVDHRLQIAWSVELSNGSPYLLSLGISKSLLAFVWIAGPLSGTLVQPYVGMKSDRCRSRFGKRRPFMVGGAAATIVSLLALAWTRELVGGVLGIFRVPYSSDAVSTVAIVFAILMIYVLDFSINVIQAGIRAFIVDNAPTHQQDSANAWASRISGVGNIIGYLFGYVDLPRYFWFLGNTQFKVLCVIASFAMASTLAVSVVSIRERDPRLEGDPEKEEGGVLPFFRNLYYSIRKLPPQISKVCQVQFFAWIGWFPFLFYITTYVGEIYAEPVFLENPNMTPEDIEVVWQRATRAGTFALFMFAITTFVASVIIPFMVASSYQPPEPPLRTPMTPTTPRTPRPVTTESDYFSHPPAQSSPKASLCSNISSHIFKRLPNPEIRWLTLRRAWLLSHALFALLTFATFFVHTIASATVLVALMGIPWAMTNWAPFALIAAEISKRDAIRHGYIRPPPTRDGELLAHGEDPSNGADQAGVVLGIHNVAIAAPQVIATLVSSFIFRWLQKPRGSTGDESVAWVLRFGGCAALVACWLTRRVGEGEGGK
jgi:solute carrier family 45 protein 1/2/4